MAVLLLQQEHQQAPLSTCCALDEAACTTARSTTRSKPIVDSGLTALRAGHRRMRALEHLVEIVGELDTVDVQAP